MVTTSTTDTIALMAPGIAPISTIQPLLTLRARKAARSRSKSRQIHPTINVTVANELVETTPSVFTAPPQGSHLSPTGMHDYRFPIASSSTLTSRQPKQSITPPSIPVLRVNGPRPASSGRISRTPAAPHRSHRRVVSVPVGRLRPLSDGPLGYTYTPVASRPSESLEFFLPPEHFVRHNTSNISLVVSICGPAEEQVIVCTPGTAHAMGVEKKKGRIMKGAGKMWRFFRRRVYR
ncbi:hypothetical protein P171DRAFT_429940 [Karstenula rhodostoma CBS 690.94]|uniref:Uncharacterized protein n=1 Tax=Karstenula rhodostoma CBS 690.94 TaxID=1392251 RepID=A0A9P4UE34_9PLEO|nr:hypothetical protein P171DRAFT_429940 [Karstenula rhodostoma CBS 690.94]